MGKRKSAVVDGTEPDGVAEVKHETSKEGDSTPRKLKRKSKEPTSPATPDLPKPTFTLADVTSWLCEKPPEFLDVRDEQLSLAIMEGMERGMMDDMVAWFLQGEGVHADEKASWGPPKWQYSKGDPYDSFDFYAANGCPNCGAAYELDLHHAFCYDPPALVCLDCGHRACRLHFDNESESLVDRLETKGKKSLEDAAVLDGSDPTSPFTSGDSTSSSSSSVFIPGAVYIRGSREKFDFGQTGKEWWQSRYLPRQIRLKDLNRTMTMIALMSKFKAPTCDELCEVCGNNRAYYHSYQARSADEGMTLMYECTQCHARKTFNN